MCVVVVSHDDVVREYADHVQIMTDGRLNDEPGARAAVTAVGRQA